MEIYTVKNDIMAKHKMYDIPRHKMSRFFGGNTFCGIEEFEK